jgi:hypothetical protein
MNVKVKPAMKMEGRAFQAEEQPVQRPWGRKVCQEFLRLTEAGVSEAIGKNCKDTKERQRRGQAGLGL